MPDLAARLDLVTFNAWVGQRDRALRNNLIDLVDDAGYPDILSLQEVWDWDGTIPGYDPIRAPHDEFPHPEARSTILLVRRRPGIEIQRTGFIDVADHGGTKWVGPKHGEIHPPRVFPWVRALVDDQPWGVLGIHRTPGGPRPGIRANAPSWAAEDEAIVCWFAAHPRIPCAAVGDQNARRTTVGPTSPRGLAKRVEGRLILKGIDGAIATGARPLYVEELRRRDHYGSDGHDPVLITLKENHR